MVRSTTGAASNADQAPQQRDQLRGQLRAVEQQHEHMMQALNSYQKDAVRQNTRTMQQIQQRVNTRLQQIHLHQELAKSTPDPKRISETGSSDGARHESMAHSTSTDGRVSRTKQQSGEKERELHWKHANENGRGPPYHAGKQGPNVSVS